MKAFFLFTFLLPSLVLSHCKFFAVPWGTHNCSPNVNRSSFLEIPLFGSCVLSCSFVDRVYRYFCWENGWDDEPQVQHCFTETCLIIHERYPSWDWAWKCNLQSVEARVLKGTICTGTCLTNSKEKVTKSATCVGHNDWLERVGGVCPHFGCEPLSKRVRVEHGELECHATGIHYCVLKCHQGYAPRGSSVFFCSESTGKYKEKLLNKDLDEDYERKLVCEKTSTIVFGVSLKEGEFVGHVIPPSPDSTPIPSLLEDFRGKKAFGIWFLGHLFICWGKRTCRSLVRDNHGLLSWANIQNSRWVIEDNADFVIEKEVLHVIGKDMATSYSGVTDKTILVHTESNFPPRESRCVFNRPNGDAMILGFDGVKNKFYQFEDGNILNKSEIQSTLKFQSCIQMSHGYKEHYLLTTRDNNLTSYLLTIYDDESHNIIQEGCKLKGKLLSPFGENELLCLQEEKLHIYESPNDETLYPKLKETMCSGISSLDNLFMVSVPTSFTKGRSVPSPAEEL